MKRFIKILLAVCLVTAAAAAFAAPAFAGAGPGEFPNPGGPIVWIANRGLHDTLPENSLAALKAAHAAGAEYVLTDVSATSDGVTVLMEAHSAARMLSGGQTKPDTADYEWDVLKAIPLRAGSGGAGREPAGAPEYTVSLLEALGAARDGGFTLVLKFDVSLTDRVLASVNALGMEGQCILYPTGKTKEVLSAAETLGGRYSVIAEKRSNVIFDVTSFIRRLQDACAAGAVLKTSNRYGVIYYKSTLRRCETLRAVADTSTPGVTGWREDTAKWWDDLISRGYSAIITDDPAGFAVYMEENAAARERLSLLTQEMKNKTLPRFGSPLASDYKKNYDDAFTAAEALLADASSSSQDLRDAYTALKTAAQEIDSHFDEIDAGTAGSTLTLPRILLCVGAAAAVIAAQVYFFKKRKDR